MTFITMLVSTLLLGCHDEVRPMFDKTDGQSFDFDLQISKRHIGTQTSTY